MRIVAGKAGGIVLQVPKGEVRPTADKVREALFSILGDKVIGAAVLDLFSGSGGLALEALSRGASSAVMVDYSKASCDVIRKNMEKCRLDGGMIVQADAGLFLKRELRGARKYDLVFADPPYCKGILDRDFIQELAKGGVAKLLAGDGLFIAEVQEGWGTGVSDSMNLEGLALLDVRHYGKNMLLFYHLKKEDNP